MTTDDGKYLCGGPDCSGHTDPRKRCLATGTESWTAAEMAREVEFLDPRPEPEPEPAESPAAAERLHEEAAYAAESASDDDDIPNATPCNCEHGAHFGEDDHAAIHAYGKAPAGDQQALYVGPVCNACATEHLSEYLIQGPAGHLDPIVVDPPGENARAVAAVLNSARAELLANSTPVARNPSCCEHGYRYENALCPVTTCGAAPAVTG